MIIKIDDKTHIRVSESCFALMHPATRKGRPVWEEDKWFSSLENCMQFIAQRKIAEKEDVVDLKEFISAYRGILEDIRNIHPKNIS